MKTIYLTDKNQEYVAKNKLETAVQELLRKYHRLVFDKAGIKKFKKKLNKEIQELNKLHPRCKPIEVYFWKHTQSDLTENMFGFRASAFQILEGTLQET